MAPATNDLPKTSLSPRVIDALGRKYLGRGSAAESDDTDAVDALLRDLSDPEQRAFGDYELIEVIGKGGMGVVYKARQTSLDREVAIKLMADGYWAPADVVANFRREAQAAARLHHPGIVEIYDTGEVDGLTYFSMRLVRGESLAQRISTRGALAVDTALRWLRTAAEAIDHAHRLGLLHLDLKPGNLLLGPDDEPMVADFGLARLLDAESVDEARVAGTPAYMAPEQVVAANQRLDRRTDVYGLGAVLYEALTGHPPFDGPSVNDVFRHVLEQAPADPRQRRPALPDDVAAIAMKCLAKVPEDRYATARELADDIGRFLEGRPVSVRPQGRLERFRKWLRREPLVAGLAASVVAALVAVAAVSVAQWRQSRATVDLAVELLAAHTGEMRNNGNTYVPAEERKLQALQNWVDQQDLGPDRRSRLYVDVYRRLVAQRSPTRHTILRAWAFDRTVGAAAMDRLGAALDRRLEEGRSIAHADVDFLRLDLAVVAGTMGHNNPDRIATAIERVASAGNDEFALQYAAAVCLYFDSAIPACAGNRISGRLRAIDPTNGASLNFAATLERRNKQPGEICADDLRGVAHWDEYNYRRMTRLRSAFAAEAPELVAEVMPDWSGALDEEAQVSLVVYMFGGGYLTGGPALLDSCKAARARGEEERDLWNECLRVADLLLRDARSVWTGRSTGIRLAALADRGSELYRRGRTLARQLDFLMDVDASEAAITDPHLFLAYLDDLPRKGEFDAWMALLERGGVATQPPAEWHGVAEFNQRLFDVKSN